VCLDPTGRCAPSGTVRPVCLLVVVSRLDPDAPLVVGANRDERLERPATAVTVLRSAAPRVLGGRDELAGGTWLAVNDCGVVAGLTNRPAPDGRDPAKRSRGELAVALCRHRQATAAVEDFVARFRPEDYNPAWLLVGDRTSLYALDMTEGDRPGVEELGPGVHILENNPLHQPSPKVDRVRALLGAATTGASGREVLDALPRVLADHGVPPSSGERRPETLAACVHSEDYGTRSSTVVVVPAGDGPPGLQVADGPPCVAPFTDASSLWR